MMKLGKLKRALERSLWTPSQEVGKNQILKLFIHFHKTCVHLLWCQWWCFQAKRICHIINIQWIHKQYTLDFLNSGFARPENLLTDWKLNYFRIS